MSIRRILIVDDDEAVRSLLRLTLPKEGFELVEASDGAEALASVAERVPDLILLDWRMPGRSGGEVLLELRQRHSELPVIVLTAEKRSFPRSLAEALKADAFLTKPFSPLELLGEVERLLPERPADRC